MDRPYCDLNECLARATHVVIFREGGKQYHYCSRHCVGLRTGKQRGWDPAKVFLIERLHLYP